MAKGWTSGMFRNLDQVERIACNRVDRDIKKAAAKQAPVTGVRRIVGRSSAPAPQQPKIEQFVPVDVAPQAVRTAESVEPAVIDEPRTTEVTRRRDIGVEHASHPRTAQRSRQRSPLTGGSARKRGGAKRSLKLDHG